jgi:type IV secretion system protein TrbD
MTGRTIQGFEVDIHQSLIEVILLGGLPRNLALVLWTSTAAMVLGLHVIWILPFAFMLYVPLTIASKKDPYFFEVFKRALRTPKRLVP